MALPLRRFHPEAASVAKTRLDGVHEWLFLVDDGSGILVASGSQGNEIRMGEIDPADLISGTYAPTWFETGIDGPAFNGLSAPASYASLSDHWHVFDGAYHWIAVTLDQEYTPSTGVGIARLSDFRTVDFVRWIYDVADETDPAEEKITTQDLWCVVRQDGAGGIAIGIVRNGSGRSLKILFVDEDGNVDRPDGGEWTGLAHEFGCGGSATWDAASGRFRVLAPKQMNACDKNPIYLIDVSDGWDDPVQTTVLADSDASHSGIGYTMPTEADLGDGYRAVAVLRAFHGESCDFDNHSPIILLILDPDGNQIQELPVTPWGSRPHILLFGDTLYVCYDVGVKKEANPDTGQPEGDDPGCYVSTFSVEQFVSLPVGIGHDRLRKVRVPEASPGAAIHRTTPTINLGQGRIVGNEPDHGILHVPALRVVNVGEYFDFAAATEQGFARLPGCCEGLDPMPVT